MNIKQLFLSFTRYKAMKTFRMSLVICAFVAVFLGINYVTHAQSLPEGVFEYNENVLAPAWFIKVVDNVNDPQYMVFVRRDPIVGEFTLEEMEAYVPGGNEIIPSAELWSLLRSSNETTTWVAENGETFNNTEEMPDWVTNPATAEGNYILLYANGSYFDAGYVSSEAGSGSTWAVAHIRTVYNSLSMPSYGGGNGNREIEYLTPNGGTGNDNMTGSSSTGTAVTGNISTTTTGASTTTGAVVQSTGSTVTWTTGVLPAWPSANPRWITMTVVPLPAGAIERKDAARMFVFFAKILDKNRQLNTSCVYPDIYGYGIDDMDRSYILEACRMGLMGLKADWSVAETFVPYGIFSKTQFGTVLSRMLYGDKYNSINPDDANRYGSHLSVLQNAWLISKEDFTKYADLSYTWTIFQKVKKAFSIQ